MGSDYSDIPDYAHCLARQRRPPEPERNKRLSLEPAYSHNLRHRQRERHPESDSDGFADDEDPLEYGFEPCLWEGRDFGEHPESSEPDKAPEDDSVFGEHPDISEPDKVPENGSWPELIKSHSCPIVNYDSGTEPIGSVASDEFMSDVSNDQFLARSGSDDEGFDGDAGGKSSPLPDSFQSLMLRRTTLGKSEIQRLEVS